MPNENSYERARKERHVIRQGLAETPEKFTMLTGDRPTGRLHRCLLLRHPQGPC